MEPNRHRERGGRPATLVRIVALIFGALTLLGVGGAAIEPSLSEAPVVASEAFTPTAAASTVVRGVRHAPARQAQRRPATARKPGGPVARDEAAAPRSDPGPPDPRGPPGATAR